MRAGRSATQAATQYALQLEPYNVSSTVVTEMRQHAKDLETIHKTLNEKISKDVNDAREYSSLLHQLDVKANWFKTNSHIARGMVQGMKKARKKGDDAPSTSSKK